jgi:hypothetical protein
MATRMRSGTVPRAAVVDGAWLGRGAIAGIVGGVALMIFEMAVAGFSMGLAWAQLPVRMAGGILLGPGALDARAPIAAVATAGALVHLALSAAFGLLFAAIVDARHARDTWLLAGAALLYGTALWVVNFYVVAPLAGFDWFAQLSNPVIQFVGHGIVYAPVAAITLQPGAPPVRRRARERTPLRRAA